MDLQHLRTSRRSFDTVWDLLMSAAPVEGMPLNVQGRRIRSCSPSRKCMSIDKNPPHVISMIARHRQQVAELMTESNHVRSLLLSTTRYNFVPRYLVMPSSAEHDNTIPFILIEKSIAHALDTCHGCCAGFLTAKCQS
jgi:hypothetical protein